MKKKYIEYITKFPKGVPKYIKDIPYGESKWVLNKKITEYEIISKLGQGAYGSVYLAKKDGIKYVLKKLKLNKVSINDILHEVEALNKITKYNDCKNINTSTISSICLIDDFVDHENGDYIIVTNYLENGKSLNQILNDLEENEESLSVENILFIFYNLIIQLDFLHSHKIVHGDIKPQNIVVQYENKKIKNVIFIDFGISCIKECRPGGTVQYMAPELFRIYGIRPEDVKKLKGKMLSDKETVEEGKTIPINKEDYMKTDVFSLGLVFYEITNKQMPYPFKPDYIRNKIRYYKENILEFELELDNLLKTEGQEHEDDKILYEEIMELNKKENSEEDILDMKIQKYVKNKLPSGLLSVEQIFTFYNYYKNEKYELKSTYKGENEIVTKAINDIINKMLIINPLHRQGIHRIKQKFKKDLYKVIE